MSPRYLIDMHVHTCLSPCGESTMIPPAIVAAAVAAGLSALAVTDHNAAGNIAAVVQAALSSGIEIVAGMEITTAEEIHVVALLPDLDSALALEALVHAHLPGINDAERFGGQWIVDAAGYIAGKCEKLLVGACDLSIERVIDAVHGVGGLAVPAHVDRGAFSLTSQLGFVPEGLEADAFEVSACGLKELNRWRRLGAPILGSSDAHTPAQIGRVYTRMSAASAGFAGIAEAVSCAERSALEPMLGA